MKIYITEQDKQELEAKIAQLEENYREYVDWEGKLGELQTLKEMLSISIVLPVEESWYDVTSSPVLENIYPKGVIIKSN